MIDFEECLKLGLLARIPPSKNQALEQMKKANVLLSEAKKAQDAGLANSAVISAYAAILDSARAVLFKDGYREKSHACVARYLETKYSKEIGKEWICLLDEYRDKRHKTMYSGGYYPTKEESKRVVLFAEKFVREMERLI